MASIGKRELGTLATWQGADKPESRNIRFVSQLVPGSKVISTHKGRSRKRSEGWELKVGQLSPLGDSQSFHSELHKRENATAKQLLDSEI
ncbi:MAG: hypothetical protein CL912_11980 [Deltaproteobacteria bacterium]|nr:hypothetical protein [Deltaproteobacteria bacterium]|tara:strand:+ start:418 stop:687 length:270 start_codon:yes stop_codon:yes gene_type:complete